MKINFSRLGRCLNPDKILNLVCVDLPPREILLSFIFQPGIKYGHVRIVCLHWKYRNLKPQSQNGQNVLLALSNQGHTHLGR